MELKEALAQIYEIRQQVAQTEVFRGYRAVTVGFTGLLAIACGFIQAAFIPDPFANLFGYFTLWVGAAIFSMILTGWEMYYRCRRSPSALAGTTTLMAVGQFVPAVGAGGLLMIVLLIFKPESIWMLPSLWCILFSLGIFASFRLLPKATFYVGVFYLLAGLITLAVSQEDLSPWTMGVPFGIGQLFAALILYWTLERHDVEPQISND